MPRSQPCEDKARWKIIADRPRTSSAELMVVVAQRGAMRTLALQQASPVTRPWWRSKYGVVSIAGLGAIVLYRPHWPIGPSATRAWDRAVSPQKEAHER
jgi:hypothetical protein